MTTSALLIALLMGFTGSLHCAGMCGPIIWVMPFNMMSGWKKWLGIFLYHFGRISIYALLALILQSFKSFFDPHIQQYISIVLGSVLLLLGIFSFLPTRFLKYELPWTGFIRRHIGTFISRPSPAALIVTGMLNGMLPCGLVYMALSAAIVAGSPLSAVAMMYAFGIGTLPMLVGITILKRHSLALHFGKMKKMVPALMFVFGCLFVLRGLNLNIPYLSPKVEVHSTTPTMSCCHKK